MPTNRARITVNLSDEAKEYVAAIANTHGKTMSWAIEKIILTHRNQDKSLMVPNRKDAFTNPDMNFNIDDVPLAEELKKYSPTTPKK